jgi:hypothetical protein
MTLGGLTTLAAPESLLMESKPLSRQPFPTDVILCKDKKLQMKQLPTNLISRVRMYLMYIRVRPVSSHGMILMLSRTLGIETFSA